MNINCLAVFQEKIDPPDYFDQLQRLSHQIPIDILIVREEINETELNPQVKPEDFIKDLNERKEYYQIIFYCHELPTLINMPCIQFYPNQKKVLATKPEECIQLARVLYLLFEYEVTLQGQGHFEPQGITLSEIMTLGHCVCVKKTVEIEALLREGKPIYCPHLPEKLAKFSFLKYGKNDALGYLYFDEKEPVSEDKPLAHFISRNLEIWLHSSLPFDAGKMKYEIKKLLKENKKSAECINSMAISSKTVAESTFFSLLDDFDADIGMEVDINQDTIEANFNEICQQHQVKGLGVRRSNTHILCLVELVK